MKPLATAALLLLALAWVLTRGVVQRRALVCPPQCEVSMESVGGGAAGGVLVRWEGSDGAMTTERSEGLSAEALAEINARWSEPPADASHAMVLALVIHAIEDVPALVAEVHRQADELALLHRERVETNAHNRRAADDYLSRFGHDANCGGPNECGCTVAEVARGCMTEVVRELARLRAIVEGRTVPPTDAEIAAHPAWLVCTLPRGPHQRGGGHVRVTPSTAPPYRRYPGRWWALDAEGRPCAWPTTGGASE